MRLIAKIFLSVMTVFSIAFMVAGYLLLSHFLDVNVQREIDFALRQYQFDKFAFQSNLLSSNNWQYFQMESTSFQLFLGDVCESMEQPVSVFAEDGKVLFSNSKLIEGHLFSTFSPNQNQYRLVDEGGGYYILVGGQIALSQMKLNLVTQTDITAVIEQYEVLQGYFRNCLLVSLGAVMVLVFVITSFLTRPLRKMVVAADRIADGNYHERLNIRQGGEVGDLADSFNRMTAAVEDKVNELQHVIQRKEDFVENFAHELKTPMTSVIGYADMIYQKELPREEVKSAAWYIWNEGMRLEAMALKMMDLTVMNHQEIMLVDVPADEFLKDVASGLQIIWNREGVNLFCEGEAAYIKIDYDLMKSVLLNLIDNAKKADSYNIRVRGYRVKNQYMLTVSDDGKGIPEEELSRITEAFYMVDKSRSRKQHGAGLGLSLVSRIVELHHGELTIESKVGEGTNVCVLLPYVEEEEA